uniref:Transcription repressor n=1 Tax=Solanum lycopersicum TaxID=4081 RepID=A0A3Q7E9I4_SOLLC
MSSKIKQWNFRKLFISNGVGCRSCSKPNLVDIIEPKPKIPINTNPSPKICYTSSDMNSESKIITCPNSDDIFIFVKNLDDPFQDNHTSIPFSIINIDSLSPPSIDKNDVTKLSKSETNSEFKVSTCVKNLDDSFQDNYYTSATSSIKKKSLSPRNLDQNEYTNSEANPESRVDSCSKISSSLVAFINSDDPFYDFKKSMLHMIIEKEIYSFEDLEDLLNCFLKLNSPSHHNIIIQAFTEILNDNKKIVFDGPRKNTH